MVIVNSTLMMLTHLLGSKLMEPCHTNENGNVVRRNACLGKTTGVLNPRDLECEKERKKKKKEGANPIHQTNKSQTVSMDTNSITTFRGHHQISYVDTSLKAL